MGRRLHKVGRLNNLIERLAEGARTALALAEGRAVDGDPADDLETLRVALDEATGYLKLQAWRDAAKEDARMRATETLHLVKDGPVPPMFRVVRPPEREAS